MTYRDRLSPWVIVRLLPKMQRVVVARFRNRSNAEGHLHRLRQLMPDVEFVIIFETGEELDKK
ncbi:MULTISPECIES: hypothetical protein [unclassified Moorena]|uniref:hypothetical protein n=1 Tax=unclassified Moorena TaxID=2683338 RepID=UPI001400CFC2|nr:MULTISPECIES: hypothetical protein [unclassified Moorena]NEO15414.1 hypothetical protein [Moorena sp. SIO3E8]NEQ01816.1 hypothetical protein [Moorena sp. SIO3F7]